MLIRPFPVSFTKNRTVLAVLLTFVSMISACASLGDQDADKSREFDTAVTLIAATNKDTYAQTEFITVTASVVVLDMDDNKVSLDRGGDTPLARYQIVVFDEQGKLVPQTPEGFGRVAVGRHHLQYPIDQDSPDHEAFRIDTWFELSKPGKYTLILMRPAWIPEALNLISNPVTFTRLP
jgi:hypothetical protein